MLGYSFRSGGIFLTSGAMAVFVAAAAVAQTAPVPQTQPAPTAQACPIAAPDTPPPSTPPSNALPYRAFPPAWQAKLDQLVAANVIPGAVVIVKSPIWGVRVGTAGYTNIPEKIKLSPAQQFRVGSVSKMFLGQAFLQLEQEGKVKLSDPVLKYLANEPTVAAIPHIERVTIADLLQMTSGITNYLGNPSISGEIYTNPSRQYLPRDLMAVLDPKATPVLPPDFAPGATYPNPYWVTLGQSAPPAPAPFPFWYYSNSNYILLGMVAEKITGTSSTEFLRKYITEKIGLKDTFLAESEKRLPYMHGYTQYNPELSQKVYQTWCDVTAINPSYAGTAGAMISTPWDLLHFLETALKTDRFLNAGTKQKWLSFASADIHYGWEPMEYAVGALMQPHRSYGDARGHGGAFPGYKTLAYYFFDSDTSFVLASNTWDGSAEVTMLDELMPLVTSEVTTPKPARKTLVSLAGGSTLPVSWQAGRVDALSYHVYSGTDADKVDAATAENHEGVQFQTVSQVNAVLGGLKPATAYYWRVDIVGPTGIVPGALWSFNTTKAARATKKAVPVPAPALAPAQ
ncbi:serine hydrolase domain-containing protein [Magnetospirillum molischianum]|uniref:Putative Serine-type D-Ala-D-Ala carboxypeptidase n=1 Tax=Magnetospirillum molischianum DSM 120 TaxID=1150626 RepID=H8FPU4_MAGML|nr:serine hydrolase domain-containing protein [Magnetospirillum molischianum]CCG40382.1 putative Serine-type D-Ala-D-Ala carboxypeptidase [Magnetospirillum molischianum DSM 120]